jgi:hypothetical protein
MAKVRCQIQLDSSDHLMANCPFEIFDLEGAVIASSEAEAGAPEALIEGARLTVEPVTN